MLSDIKFEISVRSSSQMSQVVYCQSINIFSKPGSHHVESPLARNDLKRPHPKDPPHMPAAHNSASSKPPVPAHHSGTPGAAYPSNPYTKQSRFVCTTCLQWRR